MVSSIEQPNDFMIQLQSDNNVNIHGVTLSSLSGTSPSGESMIFINGGANITVSGVNFYGGRIGFQFASNVADSVNILGNAFFGTLSPFFYANNYPTNSIIRDNFGYDSVGKLPILCTQLEATFLPHGAHPGHLLHQRLTLLLPLIRS